MAREEERSTIEGQESGAESSAERSRAEQGPADPEAVLEKGEQDLSREVRTGPGRVAAAGGNPEEVQRVEAAADEAQAEAREAKVAAQDAIENPEGQTPSPEDAKSAEAVIAEIPKGEWWRLDRGLVAMGFGIQEIKAKAFGGLFEKAIKLVQQEAPPGLSPANAKAFEEEQSQRWTVRLLKEYRDDHRRVEKRAEENRLSFWREGKVSSKLEVVSAVTKTALWGRLLLNYGGGSSLRALNPFRTVTAAAMFAGRFGEKNKEARLKSHEAIEQTRIQDEEAAAEEAWALYEAAQGNSESGEVTKEALSAEYQQRLPQDILNRLARGEEQGELSGFFSKIAAGGIRRKAERIAGKLDQYAENGPLGMDMTPAERKQKQEKILKSYEKFLRDAERIVGDVGTIDAIGYWSRLAEKTGKGVGTVLAVDTLATGVINLVKHSPDMLRAIGEYFDRDAEAHPAGASGQIGASGHKLNIPKHLEKILASELKPVPVEIPDVPSHGGVLEVHEGDSLWKMLKNHPATEGMNEEQKSAFIASAEKKLRALSPEELKHLGFSSGNIDLIYPDEKLNLSSVLEDGGTAHPVVEGGGHVDDTGSVEEHASGARPEIVPDDGVRPDEVIVPEEGVRPDIVNESEPTVIKEYDGEGPHFDAADEAYWERYRDNQAALLWEAMYPGEAAPARLLERAEEMAANGIPFETHPLFISEAESRAEDVLKIIYGHQGGESHEWQIWKNYQASDVLKMDGRSLPGEAAPQLHRYLRQLSKEYGIEPDSGLGHSETVEEFVKRANVELLKEELHGGSSPGIEEALTAAPAPAMETGEPVPVESPAEVNDPAAEAAASPAEAPEAVIEASPEHEFRSLLAEARNLYKGDIDHSLADARRASEMFATITASEEFEHLTATEQAAIVHDQAYSTLAAERLWFEGKQDNFTAEDVARMRSEYAKIGNLLERSLGLDDGTDPHVREKNLDALIHASRDMASQAIRIRSEHPDLEDVVVEAEAESVRWVQRALEESGGARYAGDGMYLFMREHKEEAIRSIIGLAKFTGDLPPETPEADAIRMIGGVHYEVQEDVVPWANAVLRGEVPANPSERALIDSMVRDGILNRTASGEFAAGNVEDLVFTPPDSTTFTHEIAHAVEASDPKFLEHAKEAYARLSPADRDLFNRLMEIQNPDLTEEKKMHEFFAYSHQATEWRDHARKVIAAARERQQ